MASSSTRLSDVYKEFEERANVNMIKAGSIKKTLSSPKFADRIVKYFKNHNDSYLEFIQMEEENV